MFRRKSFRVFNFVVNLMTTIAGVGFVDFGFKKLYFVRVLV